MEKKLLKKDKLSGIVKKMAADKTVYAPVQDEDNVLFKVLGPGMEPLVAFANTKNAPKKVFFPHSELLVEVHAEPQGDGLRRHARRCEGSACSSACGPAMPGVSALLDMLFDQEKWKDSYYIEKRKKRRGHLTRLRAAALRVVLLHLRGREPHLDTGGRHPADRPGGELPRGVRDPQG